MLNWKISRGRYPRPPGVFNIGRKLELLQENHFIPVFSSFVASIDT